MSITDKDKEFYAMADEFIALANKQSQNKDQGKVSATFLYAAARFNIFLVASGSNSANEFASSKEKLFEYFVDEYKKMLEEHFADYHENFDRYRGNKNKSN
ncbi:MAG: DUF3144 domain-containing protein [Thermodesulfobacteriota bacterium]|nr:DUF3144 domain-containing protein [Thermodesulfobacteriota bacterium]